MYMDEYVFVKRERRPPTDSLHPCRWTTHYLDHKFHPTCNVGRCHWRHSVLQDGVISAFGVSGTIIAVIRAIQGSILAVILNLESMETDNERRSSAVDALLVKRTTIGGTIAFWDEPLENWRICCVLEYVVLRWRANRLPVGSLSVYPEQY